jgi:hypothetical protein
MNAPSAVVRDERTFAVENQSYRWAYLVMSFGALVIVTYRGLLYRESAWDLMALVIIGGAVANIYQARHSILGRHWMRFAVLSSLVAFLTALLVVYLRHGAH